MSSQLFERKASSRFLKFHQSPDTESESGSDQTGNVNQHLAETKLKRAEPVEEYQDDMQEQEDEVDDRHAPVQRNERRTDKRAKREEAPEPQPETDPEQLNRSSVRMVQRKKWQQAIIPQAQEEEASSESAHVAEQSASEEDEYKQEQRADRHEALQNEAIRLFGADEDFIRGYARPQNAYTGDSDLSEDDEKKPGRGGYDEGGAPVEYEDTIVDLEKTGEGRIEQRLYYQLHADREMFDAPVSERLLTRHIVPRMELEFIGKETELDDMRKKRLEQKKKMDEAKEQFEREEDLDPEDGDYVDGADAVVPEATPLPEEESMMKDENLEEHKENMEEEAVPEEPTWVEKIQNFHVNEKELRREADWISTHFLSSDGEYGYHPQTEREPPPTMSTIRMGLIRVPANNNVEPIEEEEEQRRKDLQSRLNQRVCLLTQHSTQSERKKVTDCITAVLTLMINSRYEIPFIIAHRRAAYESSLTEDILWQMEKWDVMWIDRERKRLEALNQIKTITPNITSLIEVAEKHAAEDSGLGDSETVTKLQNLLSEIEILSVFLDHHFQPGNSQSIHFPEKGETSEFTSDSLTSTIFIPPWAEALCSIPTAEDCTNAFAQLKDIKSEMASELAKMKKAELKKNHPELDDRQINISDRTFLLSSNILSHTRLVETGSKSDSKLVQLENTFVTLLSRNTIIKHLLRRFLLFPRHFLPHFTARSPNPICELPSPTLCGEPNPSYGSTSSPTCHCQSQCKCAGCRAHSVQRSILITTEPTGKKANAGSLAPFRSLDIHAFDSLIGLKRKPIAEMCVENDRQKHSIILLNEAKRMNLVIIKFFLSMEGQKECVELIRRIIFAEYPTEQADGDDPFISLSSNEDDPFKSLKNLQIEKAFTTHMKKHLLASIWNTSLKLGQTLIGEECGEEIFEKLMQPPLIPSGLSKCVCTMPDPPPDSTEYSDDYSNQSSEGMSIESASKWSGFRVCVVVAEDPGDMRGGSVDGMSCSSCVCVDSLGGIVGSVVLPGLTRNRRKEMFQDMVNLIPTSAQVDPSGFEKTLQNNPYLQDMNTLRMFMLVCQPSAVLVCGNDPKTRLLQSDLKELVKRLIEIGRANEGERDDSNYSEAMFGLTENPTVLFGDISIGNAYIGTIREIQEFPPPRGNEKRDGVNPESVKRGLAVGRAFVSPLHEFASLFSSLRIGDCMAFQTGVASAVSVEDSPMSTIFSLEACSSFQKNLMIAVKKLRLHDLIALGSESSIVTNIEQAIRKAVNTVGVDINTVLLTATHFYHVLSFVSGFSERIAHLLKQRAVVSGAEVKRIPPPTRAADLAQVFKPQQMANIPPTIMLSSLQARPDLIIQSRYILVGEGFALPNDIFRNCNSFLIVDDLTPVLFNLSYSSVIPKTDDYNNNYSSDIRIFQSYEPPTQTVADRFIMASRVGEHDGRNEGIRRGGGEDEESESSYISAFLDSLAIDSESYAIVKEVCEYVIAAKERKQENTYDDINEDVFSNALSHHEKTRAAPKQNKRKTEMMDWEKIATCFGNTALFEDFDPHLFANLMWEDFKQRYARPPTPDVLEADIKPEAEEKRKEEAKGEAEAEPEQEGGSEILERKPKVKREAGTVVNPDEENSDNEEQQQHSDDEARNQSDDEATPGNEEEAEEENAYDEKLQEANALIIVEKINQQPIDVFSPKTSFAQFEWAVREIVAFLSHPHCDPRLSKSHSLHPFSPNQFEKVDSTYVGLTNQYTIQPPSGDYSIVEKKKPVSPFDLFFMFNSELGNSLTFQAAHSADGENAHHMTMAGDGTGGYYMRFSNGLRGFLRWDQSASDAWRNANAANEIEFTTGWDEVAAQPLPGRSVTLFIEKINFERMSVDLCTENIVREKVQRKTEDPFVDRILLEVLKKKTVSRHDKDAAAKKTLEENLLNRQINHPYYKNMTKEQAEQFLLVDCEGKAGSLLIRPSLTSMDRLIVSYILQDHVEPCHMEIIEMNKPNTLSLGRSLSVFGVKVESLDEVIDMVVKPIIHFCTLIVTHSKFVSVDLSLITNSNRFTTSPIRVPYHVLTAEEMNTRSLNQAEKFLKDERLKNPKHIPYVFCYGKQQARFSLCYLPSREMETREVRVTPLGMMIDKTTRQRTPDEVITRFKQIFSENIEKKKQQQREMQDQERRERDAHHRDYSHRDSHYDRGKERSRYDDYRKGSFRREDEMKRERNERRFNEKRPMERQSGFDDRRRDDSGGYGWDL